MDSRQIGLTSSIQSPSGSLAPSATNAPRAGGASFGNLVRETQNAITGKLPITISAHAQDRLKLRNITLNDDDIKKISDTMNRVAEKGGKQALFMMQTASGKNTAMVVSVRNRVVITAVDGNSLRDNIFTNIDSAAIIE